ncbi:capsule biosynthesis protein CapA [Roseobacter cerasinus]|uniref:Capsule biosynthesis protein CapA n=1 Tax=Roseobacter cerasinus TaxID=2602289 RepID=A0A640VUD5_9RHOB|nr:capsular biosynthesis protein [Roseobacter cerasinus]GFE52018.1 capsule biosynthesis protein CapA [Roseobacter cerasinus]
MTTTSVVALHPPLGKRVFLFLQGPHGPFFYKLGQRLIAAGADVLRVGFNMGDRIFWPARHSYIPFRAPQDQWQEVLCGLIDGKAVTDIVLYGDARWMHAEAIAEARRRRLRVHVFEEGYLRPYWVNYERDGSNGHSALMRMSLAEMRAAQAHPARDAPIPPCHWGDMRQHVFYGALYHGFVMALNRSYRHFRPHRALNVAQEFRLYVRRLFLMPFQSLERRITTFHVQRGGFPYHVALLQLEHDSAFQHHAPFDTMAAFLDCVISQFAAGAPAHHHLVFKAHPLEDGRAPLRRDIRRLARDYGIGKRVHYLRGGKLARLLDQARSAVTVNSTSGQQALWRGIPLRPFGDAIYNKPELVSDQPLAEFFADPVRPDHAAYRDFRAFLLQTSQIAGSFYASRGRQQLLRHVVDLMLAEHHPYAAQAGSSATDPQQINLVR